MEMRQLNPLFLLIIFFGCSRYTLEVPSSSQVDVANLTIYYGETDRASTALVGKSLDAPFDAQFSGKQALITMAHGGLIDTAEPIGDLGNYEFSLTPNAGDELTVHLRTEDHEFESKIALPEALNAEFISRNQSPGAYFGDTNIRYHQVFKISSPKSHYHYFQIGYLFEGGFVEYGDYAEELIIVDIEEADFLIEDQGLFTLRMQANREYIIHIYSYVKLNMVLHSFTKSLFEVVTGQRGTTAGIGMGIFSDPILTFESDYAGELYGFLGWVYTDTIN